ncbi:MAG: TetR/AcrR family transcriptional regulator [Dehalococcoidia bacterium]
MLKAAARFFRAYGYHGTSMNELADAVGLKKASLYHHVTSKEQLIYEILMTGMHSIISQLREILDDPSLSPTDKLRCAIRAQIVAVTGDEAYVQTTVMTDGRVLSPELQTEYIAARDTFEGQVKSIIRAGIETGEFKDCDVSLMAKAVLGICGWMVIWYHADGPKSPIEIADRFTEFLLSGLAT